MRDQDKSKDQLIRELSELRNKITLFEASGRTSVTGASGLPNAEPAEGFDSDDSDAFESTQSIDLGKVFAEHLTISGSFSFSGVNRTWFGKLLQALPIPAFLIDRSGAILFANQACDSTTQSGSALKGVSFSALFPSSEVVKDVKEVMSRVARTRKPEVATAILELGGRRIWGRLYIRSIRLGSLRSILVLVEDLTLEKEQLLLKQKQERQISQERDELESQVRKRTTDLAQANEFLKKEVEERKRAEQALRESESRYRALVENSPLGILSCDTQGRITELNPAVEHLLGLQTLEDARSIDLLSYEPLVASGVSDTIRKCLSTGEPYTGVFPYAQNQAEPVHMRIHAVPIRSADGRISGAQAAIEDVSDSKRAEGVLLRSERLKALVDMAEGVSHNFDRSLQVMTAHAETALTSVESGDLSRLKPLLEKISVNAQTASQTVRRLRQFARTRSAIDKAQGDVFDANDAAVEAIGKSKSWWNRTPDHGGAISLETDFTPGCYIQGESDEISDVLVNLIRNAAEALPQGGLIRVGTAIQNDSVILRVQDDGVGIPRKHFRRLFEPLWSSKDSHAGMGLAVSSGIIRRHRGTVTVTSKEGGGTTFVVRLPYAKNPTEAVALDAEAETRESLRILLIEGDDQDARRLEHDLSTLGQTVYLSSSGKAGVEAFRSGDANCVVCSLDLKDMTGWEVGKQIRQICIDQGVPKPPLIIRSVAAATLAEDVLRANPHVDRVVETTLEARSLLDIIHEERRTTETRSSFSGNIHGIDILEYIQILLLSGQRAVVEIEPARGLAGCVYVDSGEVRHAVCGDLEGEEALYQCLTFRRGTFASRPWSDPERITIEKPGEVVLFEAAVKRDELGTEDGDCSSFPTDTLD